MNGSRTKIFQDNVVYPPDQMRECRLCKTLTPFLGQHYIRFIYTTYDRTYFGHPKNWKMVSPVCKDCLDALNEMGFLR